MSRQRGALNQLSDVALDSADTWNRLARHIASRESTHLVSGAGSEVLQITVLFEDRAQSRIPVNGILSGLALPRVLTQIGKIHLHEMHGSVEQSDKSPIDVWLRREAD
jgi:hypothetical protein